VRCADVSATSGTSVTTKTSGFRERNTDAIRRGVRLRRLSDTTFGKESFPLSNICLKVSSTHLGVVLRYNVANASVCAFRQTEELSNSVDAVPSFLGRVSSSGYVSV
jgi:hypothetical protein